MTCAFCGGSASRAFTAFGRPWLGCRDCGSASRAAAAGEARDRSAEDHTLPPGPPSPHLQARAALVRRLAPGRRVLDLGARSGDFVLAGRTLGLLVDGHEPDAAARGRAAARGVPLHGGALDGLPDDYHAVTLWDVLAHHPDPQALVRRSRLMLVPGGLLAVSTPHRRGLRALLLGARHPGFDPAGWDHLHELTRAGLVALFDRAGLTALKVDSHLTAPVSSLLAGPGGAGTGPLGPRLAELADGLGTALRPLLEALHLGDVLVGFARR